jgi:hypothetical protein
VKTTRGFWNLAGPPGTAGAAGSDLACRGGGCAGCGGGCRFDDGGGWFRGKRTSRRRCAMAVDVAVGFLILRRAPAARPAARLPDRESYRAFAVNSFLLR